MGTEEIAFEHITNNRIAIAALKQEVDSILKKQDEFQREMKGNQQEFRDGLDSVKDKLDNLLEFRHKGAGAFWLASALFGTILMALVSHFADAIWAFFKGVS